MTKEQFEKAYEAKKLQERIGNEIELIVDHINEGGAMLNATTANLVSNMLSAEALSEQVKKNLCLDLVGMAKHILGEIEAAIDSQLGLTAHCEEA